MVAVTVRRPAHRANVDDIVALYTHPTDPKATVPVTWRKITAESPAYPKTGSGTVTFKLVNFRQNFIFRLLENGTFSPVVLAESAVMKNAIPNAPGQVHLALHADGRSIVVQWVSGSRTPQLLQYRPVTQSGLTMQNIAKDAKAIVLVSTSRTYNQGMMCGAPATTFGFITPGFLHAAVIPGGDMRHNQQLQYRWVLQRPALQVSGSCAAVSLCAGSCRLRPPVSCHHPAPGACMPTAAFGLYAFHNPAVACLAIPTLHCQPRDACGPCKPLSMR